MLTGCRNMRSDLGWRDYLSLATSLQTLNGNQIAFSAIDDKMVVDTVLSSGAAVLSPRWDRIRPAGGGERSAPAPLARPPR